MRPKKRRPKDIPMPWSELVKPHFDNKFTPVIFSNCLSFKNCDMHDEMKTEAMEVCATACEKFANNNEVSSTIWPNNYPMLTFTDWSCFCLK